MDVGIVLSVVQTLFNALQCPELRNICSLLGYQTELDDLERIVETVKAVLLDAQAKNDEDLSHQARLYVEELKDAVYDADDLFDEFLTLATLNVSNNLGCFFTRFKQLALAYRMSQGVKKVRKKLDDIGDNHNKYGFKLDSRPMRKRREETCSYVYAKDVIGREEELGNIVGLLLDHGAQSKVSFLTIVGMGGMGKTTLSQLVYNDERITKEFPTKIWVCVGDHEDKNSLNMRVILAKILESITDRKHDESALDLLQRKVRRQLVENKYLLILDDVWNENRNNWVELESFLKGGASGSWVVVTTRSTSTAKIIGDGSSYELEGLSDWNSWRLFERAAFGVEGGQANAPDLVEIGQMVVKKCANVPLAIKVVGSLLFGQGKDKWLSFQRIGLASVNPEKNGILSILKLSYHHLEAPLKSCFGYCALFPKDYEIDKEKLISLWMAQGYVVSLDKGQSIEDAAEEYFSVLLRRCFFQDVVKYGNGEIRSCKIHDLMHDVAQEVTRNEICIADCISNNLDKRVRHLSVVKSTIIEGSFMKSKVRTLLNFYFDKRRLHVDSLLRNWMGLRALDLKYLDIRSLSDTIGKLLHLRYLDLTGNTSMKSLPKSLTKLRNLETLILERCRGLIELPDDIGKLVKLRCLDTRNCLLTHMPTSLGSLSCLHKLALFVVDLSNPRWEDELEGLKDLTKLKGCLEVTISKSKHTTYDKGDTSKRGYLMNKPHLNKIEFSFEHQGCEVASCDQVVLMEDMQPHPNVKSLKFYGYKGEQFPSWGSGDRLVTSLSSLIEIDLFKCDGLKTLPSLGKLSHLKIFKLKKLMSLEYMEDSLSIGEGRASGRLGSLGEVKEYVFFPSLERLELCWLPMLKGWWRGEDNNISHPLPCFRRLSHLIIEGCRELISIPSFSKVETLSLKNSNERLKFIGMYEEEKGGEDERGGTTCCLREMITDNVRYLKLMLSMGALECLTDLEISWDNKVEKLEQVEVVWRSCSSSLRFLRIEFCSKLVSVLRGGLQHLSA